MANALLYVHYNAQGVVAPYVFHQLREMRALFSQIWFISNSPVPKGARNRLYRLVNHVWTRRNSGYDFAAWRALIERIGIARLAEFDNVAIMNDTMFGPVYSIASAFERMAHDPAVDFWGFTNNRAQPFGEQHIPDHLQTYFICFKRQVVESDAFAEFWRELRDESEVNDVIVKYETRLTQHLIEAGFHVGAVFDTLGEDVTGMRAPDFTIFDPVRLLDEGVPFVKKKAFTEPVAPDPAPIFAWLAEHTTYPQRYITDNVAS